MNPTDTTTDAPTLPSPAAPAPVRPSLAIDFTEFKLGWRLLVVATLGVGVNVNSSLLYAFGSLVMPLQKAFGWARGDLQGAIGFLFAGAILSSQLVGWLNLRYGLRRVTFTSLVALSIVLAAVTRTGANIVWLYAFFAVLPIASMGIMQVTWTQLVNLAFERNRGLALALVLSGTGLAAALIPSGVTWATGRWGWQGAFWLLALLPVGLVLPFAVRWMHVPATRARTIEESARPDVGLPGIPFRAALRTPRYWFLNVALSLDRKSVV